MAIPIASFSHRPEVHGHRGCRGLFPENTLPAFLHALALGVDVLEMDVVISQDQQVVVAHDPWLSARLGLGPGDVPIDPRTEKQQRLYAMSYAEIQQCPLGVEAHPLFPGQQPVRTHRPLLREVLQATTAACLQLGRAPVRYAVELKSTPTGDNLLHPSPTLFVELVLAELASEQANTRTTLLSFDFRILRAIRRAAPNQAVCYLLEKPRLFSQLFADLGFVPEVFGPAHRLITAELLQYLRSHYPTMHLVPWTINEQADLVTALTWGATGITTDYPDRLLRLLAAN
ncbi:MAG: glycerophosphodiester phosphodiesterase [Hymenobacter sp.]|nr:MAG: glycerophosphodiester phosphodiesterase [Hymenobacter sp.]